MKLIDGFVNHIKRVARISIPVVLMSVMLTGCSVEPETVHANFENPDILLNNMLDISFMNLTPMPGDLDGDGVSDVMEDKLGTDPENSDTDFDSITDSLEISVFKTNPLERTAFDKLLFNYMTYPSQYGTQISYISSEDKYLELDTTLLQETDYKGMQIMSEVIHINNVGKDDYITLEKTFPTIKHLKTDKFSPALYQVSDNGRKFKKVKDASIYDKGRFTTTISENGSYVILNEVEGNIGYEIKRDEKISPTYKLRGLATNFLPLGYKTLSINEEGLYSKDNPGYTSVGVYNIPDVREGYFITRTLEFDMDDKIAPTLEVISIDNVDSTKCSVLTNKTIMNDKLIVDLSDIDKTVTVLDVSKLNIKTQ